MTQILVNIGRSDGQSTADPGSCGSLSGRYRREMGQLRLEPDAMKVARPVLLRCDSEKLSRGIPKKATESDCSW